MAPVEWHVFRQHGGMLSENQKRTRERISKSSASVKEDRREKAKVVQTSQEMGRRDVLKRMANAPVRGKRRRHETRWKDSCKRDMESVGLKEEDALDRTKWKNDIQNHSGDTR